MGLGAHRRWQDAVGPVSGVQVGSAAGIILGNKASVLNEILGTFPTSKQEPAHVPPCGVDLGRSTQYQLGDLRRLLCSMRRWQYSKATFLKRSCGSSWRPAEAAESTERVEPSSSDLSSTGEEGLSRAECDPITSHPTDQQEGNQTRCSQVSREHRALGPAHGTWQLSPQCGPESSCPRSPWDLGCQWLFLHLGCLGPRGC